jgi:hypothetical protein
VSRLVSIHYKDPVLSEAGRRGAAKRWGPPIRVRLDDFAPDERAAIVAAIEAKRAAKAARNEKAARDVSTRAATTTEGTRNAASSE